VIEKLIHPPCLCNKKIISFKTLLVKNRFRTWNQRSGTSNPQAFHVTNRFNNLYHFTGYGITLDLLKNDSKRKITAIERGKEKLNAKFDHLQKRGKQHWIE
jgi:hypothetical protein